MEAGVIGMQGTILLYEKVVNVLRLKVVRDNEGMLCYLPRDDSCSRNDHRTANPFARRTRVGQADFNSDLLE